jgi:hypothetical protein
VTPFGSYVRLYRRTKIEIGIKSGVVTTVCRTDSKYSHLKNVPMFRYFMASNAVAACGVLSSIGVFDFSFPFLSNSAKMTEMQSRTINSNYLFHFKHQTDETVIATVVLAAYAMVQQKSLFQANEPDSFG